MSKWSEVKVKDICEKIISGGTPLRSKKEYYDDGHIPWLKTAEVKKGYIYNTGEKITPEGLANSSAKLVPQNSIIVAMYGDGDTAGSVGVNKIELATNQACCNLIVNAEIAYYRFLYFYLKGSYNNLVNLKLGGSQQNLNAHTIKNFDISMPPLPTQKKIAAILSAYDDLIENNKKRIALLEKAAEEIYREWFVRMRFPGWEKAKFEKGIPAGWDVKKVKEIVNRKRFGKTYKENEVFPEGAIVVIDQSRKPYLGFYDGDPEHKASPDEPMILFGDHSCKMELMMKPFSLAENVIPFTPENNTPATYLFYLIKGSIETTEYKRHWTELTNKEVLIPPTNLQEKFAALISNHVIQVDKFREINLKFSTTRDLLLSRLISGKLPVDDLDIHFPPNMVAD
jgi:type I restriction enzyme, S subunit